jgi:hypothetical protein
LAVKLRSFATFSNMIALCALFVALGGTSYAVTKIGSKQIRNNSVRSADIRNGTIRPRDIAPAVTGKTLQSSAGQATRDVGPLNVESSDNEYTTVATIGGLAPGAYVLLAKVNQNADRLTEGRCRIEAEGEYDYSNRGLRPQGTPEAHNLQLIHRYAGTGAAVLACRSANGVWSAADAKLIVIRVASASSNVVGG